MSYRQINLTISEEQQKYIRSHKKETIVSMAKRFGISVGKLSTNMRIMGLSKEPRRAKIQPWEQNGFFNEKEFAKVFP